MIFKNFQLENLDLNKFQFYLFYGKNDGLQNELIKKYVINKFGGEISKYDEHELLTNKQIVTEELLNKSLFSNKKIIIISRATDKIMAFLDDLFEKNLGDTIIVIKSAILEKKSKLRSNFEKSKTVVVVPVYEDDAKTLLPIINKFIQTHKLKISREIVNLLIGRAHGSRNNLNNELEKIYNYSISNKQISYEAIKKLTNLSENYEVGELADKYLLQDTVNVAKILNENNYSDEDCILILRPILFKSKRLLEIIKRYNNVKNMDQVIIETKPPIFWKDKENIKKQINTWDLEHLKEKIYKINEIEALVKNNSKNSLNIISNFIVNYQ